jgi:hypothetical protein
MILLGDSRVYRQLKIKEIQTGGFGFKIRTSDIKIRVNPK